MREFEACTNSSREDQNDKVSVSGFNQSYFSIIIIIILKSSKNSAEI